MHDPIQLNQHFSGYQVPYLISYQTRYLPIVGDKHPLIYSKLSGEYQKVSLLKPLSGVYSRSDELNLRLGEGALTTMEFELLAPLTYEQAFSLNWFSKVNGKDISTDIALLDLDTKSNSKYNFMLGEQRSFQTQIKTGLNLSLPMERYFNLDKSIIGKQIKSSEIKKSFLIHRLSWNLDYWYRFQPYKQGAYGSLETKYQFNSIDDQWVRAERGAKPLTYTLHESQDLEREHKIRFSTIHRLLLSSANREKALLRLKNGKTKTPEHEVLLFRAAIDYDFEKQKQPGRNYDLAYFGKTRHALSPLKTLFSIHWSPLNSNFLSEYDFFEKDFAYFDFSLSLDFPLNLKLSYGLNYKKTFEQDSNFTDVFLC